jgi:hypothetical protein
MQIPSVTEKLQSQLIQGPQAGSTQQQTSVPPIVSERDGNQGANAIDPDSARSGKGQNLDLNI